MLGKLSLSVNVNLFELHKIGQTVWLPAFMLFCRYFLCYVKEKAYQT